MNIEIGTPRIVFQVTTKGNIPIVQDTVDRVHAACREVGYRKYDVWVVTDAEEEFEGCRNIVVPEDYSCNAIYKARALQYAVEMRKREGKNDEDVYVFHLDDESIVTRQTVLSLLSYLEGDQAPISEGLIIYPLNDDEKFRIEQLFDTLRPFYCFECIHFMDRGNSAHMHGSNLLVRSDVEERVGWDNGKTFAEDTLFAIKARSRLGQKAFGWHGGVVEEKNPYTLGDLVKQRKRWFYGFIQNLKYFPLRTKLSQMLRVLVWVSGFPSSLVSLIALFVPQDIPEAANVLLLSMAVMWLLSYQIGAYLNGRYLSTARRIRFHLLTLLCSPILGFVECSAPLLSLIDRPRSFEVVRK